MGKATARIEIPAAASAVEALFYDLKRWPVIVSGFGHVAKLTGDWPRRGAELTWDSTPHGRGRVLESVTHYEPRQGQTVAFEDERMRGTQRFVLEPKGDGVEARLELAWTLKGSQPVKPVFDFLFVRNPMKRTATTTLSRLRREVLAERGL